MSKVICQGEAQRPWEQHGQRLRRGTVPGKSEKRQEEREIWRENSGKREEVREVLGSNHKALWPIGRWSLALQCGWWEASVSLNSAVTGSN